MQETAAFAKAQTLDQHKALIHIFFAQRATKKVHMLAARYRADRQQGVSRLLACQFG